MKSRAKSMNTSRPWMPMLGVLVLLLAACQADEEESTEIEESSSEVETIEEEAGDTDDVADTIDNDFAAFFEGQTITWIIPSPPGGGFDYYARVLADHLGEYLDATVVPDNQPGAGGLLGIQNLRTSDADGLTIAIMNGTGLMSAFLSGSEGMTFDLGDDLTHLGRIGFEPILFTTFSDSPFETIDDVIGADTFRFGGSGPGASDFLQAQTLAATLDVQDPVIISGFDGSAESRLALTRGEIDGYASDVTGQMNGVDEEGHRPLLVLGRDRPDEVPVDVPVVVEMDLGTENEALMEANLALREISRLIVGPPGMDDDLTRFLRDLFMDILTDPDVLAGFDSDGRPVVPLHGSEVATLVKSIIDDTPEAFRLMLQEE